MLGNHEKAENRLWDAGDELRANSKLKSSGSFVLVLGLTFFHYPDQGRDRSRELMIQELNRLAFAGEKRSVKN